MDQFKAPILPFTTQRDLVNHERYGQTWQLALQRIRPISQPLAGQSPREGQMKPELVEDVRVAPLCEQRLLPGTQTRLAAPRELCLARGRAKPVKITHEGLGQALQFVHGPDWRERQKLSQCRQLQAITSCRGERIRKRRGGVFQSLDRLTLFQPEWRFQGAMKSIFLRCHRDVMQTRQIELRHLTARHNIPAQPFRAEVGQWALGRHIVNCETSV